MTMARFAKISGNTVVDAIVAEPGFSIPGFDLVQSNTAGPGDTYDPQTGSFTKPEPPPPPRRMIGKSVIISRLTDQQVADAVALLTPKQAERWRAPDKPAVYFDDAETVAILNAVGANVEEVMAP